MMRRFTQALLLAAMVCASAFAATHWAFRPIVEVQPPELSNHQRCQTPVDLFIQAKLEENGLKPAPGAEPGTLIRRISFDLTGLPPTESEMAQFLEAFAANRIAAVDELVNRLLHSPRYGERWGRWWLDVARYADTNGQDENKVMANAWRYRDWVIRAFNSNKPFDEFIMEQLAGDLLPAATNDAVNFDRLIATGFLVLGPKMLAEQDKPKLVMDIVDEQIDTVGRAFLGLTVGCARCHDHKFDPVPARDYYAMAGIFKSTRTMADLAFVSKFNERPVTPKAQLEAIAAHEQALKEQTNRLAELRKTAGTNSTELAALEAAHARLEKSAPSPASYALAVQEEKPVDLPVHIRGSHLSLAKEPVPRGFIQAVAPFGGEIPPEHSGRLELAQWITDRRNPLTARVIVNRVWQGHFGEGLVRTADNFGLRGEAPSHPELLDWLAGEFVRSGWNLKALHRLIIRSGVFQQASRAPANADPENRLLSHFPRQRLEAEMVRDAVLAVSGRLDPSSGGSIVDWKNNEYVPGSDAAEKSLRRTVYLPIVRDRVFDALTIFDFANPSVCTAKRVPTVVSHQALFFLNSPLVQDAAQTLANELCARRELNDAERIRKLYLRVLNRPAAPAEIERALRFLMQLSDSPAENLAAFCQVLLASNEFMYRF